MIIHGHGKRLLRFFLAYDSSVQVGLDLGRLVAGDCLEQPALLLERIISYHTAFNTRITLFYFHNGLIFMASLPSTTK